MEETEPVPKGPALLRFWGVVTEMALGLRRAKYVIIPYSFFAIAALIGFGVGLWEGYRDTVANGVPDQIAIHDLIDQVPDRKYIAVTGTTDQEHAYEREDSKTERYYWLWMFDEAILIRADGSQFYGTFTGVLRPLEGQLSRLVKEDAQAAAAEGINVLSTHYLDTNFRPKGPLLYYIGFAVVLFGLVALVLPQLQRYAVFRAERGPGGEYAYPQSEWPVPVEATGTFRPEGGRGLGHFDGLHPSDLVPDENGGFRVSTQFGNRAYQIPIPPGSQAVAGLDYTGGQTKAGVRVRAGGQTIYLRVASMQLARQLVAAIEEAR